MGGYQGDNTTGFQSPAQDYIEGVLDLAKVLDLRRPGVVCVAMISGDVILATLAKRAGDWLLIPSSGVAVAITEDVEVWAVVHALVRTEL